MRKVVGGGSCGDARNYKGVFITDGNLHGEGQEGDYYCCICRLEASRNSLQRSYRWTDVVLCVKIRIRMFRLAVFVVIMAVIVAVLVVVVAILVVVMAVIVAVLVGVVAVLVVVVAVLVLVVAVLVVVMAVIVVVLVVVVAVVVKVQVAAVVFEVVKVVSCEINSEVIIEITNEKFVLGEYKIGACGLRFDGMLRVAVVDFHMKFVLIVSNLQLLVCWKFASESCTF